jgi:adenine/guanine phosphoribosyltransferase-like PRPP-binding protein
VGDSDKQIVTVDADGVALAAIQGLNAKVESVVATKDTEITALKRELADLRASHQKELADLRLTVDALMARASRDGRVAAAH